MVWVKMDPSWQRLECFKYHARSELNYVALFMPVGTIKHASMNGFAHLAKVVLHNSSCRICSGIHRKLGY